jgi:hypothetical protein
MSGDYLWDRSGSDRDIEKLESVLGCLAFKGGSLPKLVVPKRAGFFAFRLSWGFQAAAAMACVAVIALGAFWMVRPRPGVAPEPDHTVDPRQAVIQMGETSNRPQQPVEVPRAPARRSILTAEYRASKKKSAAKVRHGEKLVAVTAEEAAAYDQLMLALSITSSKLRIVHDAVAGIEKDSYLKKSDK